jgi:uncharacterized membrane protein
MFMATNEQTAYELRRTRDGADAYREGIPSRVAIAHHPIHPILVTLPVTTLVGALVTDLVYWRTGDAFWAEASYWLLLAGIVTAVLAAITGMIDFFSIDRVRRHAAGWIHAILNVTALLISLVNWWLRTDNLETVIVPWGLLLSAMTAVALSISGWYGGELIYRYKVAVFGDLRQPDEHPVR